ncbi:MAG: DUF2520 domain-containing protein [Actinobacteria bacterium]|nr:DUF2520 domain-containing protein [Actinomycetota bacterium]
MKKTTRINLCIIGAGRVGTTVSYTLAEKELPNIKLKAMSSRSMESLNRAKKILGSKAAGVIFTRENSKAVSLANCILICTPDDVINSVCSDIFKDKSKDFKNYYAIHFSGSKSLEVLNSARAAGAEIASIHPLKSFASIEEAIKSLPGTIFGITYSSAESKKMAEFLVKSLGGEIIEVENNKKPLYHAAACVASNYLVTLINYAVLIHKKMGIKPEDSLKGLMGLVEGTISNIKKMGTEKSLTGPIARGDVGTIKEHVKSFNEFFSKEDSTLYKMMGIETSKIAHQNKWIKESTVGELKEILKE